MHKYDSQPAGELSDEELTNVSGGGEKSCDESGDVPRYSVGDYVRFYYTSKKTKTDFEGEIQSISATKEGEAYKEWAYHIVKDYNSMWNYYMYEFNVYEHQIYGLK